MLQARKFDSREACIAADFTDPLRRFHREFDIPKGVLYFDGNSLGAKPFNAEHHAKTIVVNEWGQGLIRSWNEASWSQLPTKFGDKIGRLIGAHPGETIVTDSTSVNLFKVMGISIRIQQIDHPTRRVIVIEKSNFPSDVYIAEGLVNFLDKGYSFRYVDDEMPPEKAICDDTVFVALSHVDYRTGRMFDMASITACAHRQGVHMIWDLAHSAGSVLVDLKGANADFAVGCTYKYLNCGPGSPGFAYVNQRHFNRVWQPLSGWWSHTRPFAMESSYDPDIGIKAMLCGTQPIVSLSLLECGLDIALRADMQLVREKSLALSDLFIYLVKKRCGNYSLSLITPEEHEKRGSHISYRHTNGYQIMQALISRGLIGDYREPEVLRFGITPLYMSFVDIWDAVEILRDVLETRAWDCEEFKRRLTVT